MIDDFRPMHHPQRPVPTDTVHPHTQIVHPASTDDTGVDEQKLEAEFGPMPYEATHPPKQSKKVLKLLPALTKHHSRKPTMIFAAIAAVIIVAAGTGSFLLISHYNPAIIPAVMPKHKYVPPPTTVASTLTGLQVSPDVNKRPVTAVMIENSIDARPQSGLDQAGIVFEALAEGGVTRFMALYQDTQPDYLGPVRSARPYYIQWLLGFDAAYAHVGGSPDALADITAWRVKDMNQFYNAAAYERISTRYAPHNVYTSAAQLNQVEASKGFTSSNFTGFARKKEFPSKTPTTTSIDLAFSGYYYNAHFDYDAATNTYKRSESGSPHMELHKDGSKVQIAPKVVVAMIVPEHAGALDSTGAYYADYATIGSGSVLVFQDGTVEKGTWSKTSNTAQITFTDTTGKPLALDAGQAWISAMPTASSVTYK